MSELYNKDYYENYGTLGSEQNYGDGSFKEYFKALAKEIVEDLSPKTVLEIGCAWGFLVEAFRDLGVEAYGVDLSPYAISKVRDDVKPYCAVCSITDDLPEPFPKYFDLVITIEMIEHLHEEECLPAIEKLCSYSDRVIVSSSADDVTDPTHYNVQQAEYWVKKFAKFNFFNRPDYKLATRPADTLLYEKTDDIPKVVSRYEHVLRLQNARYAEEKKKWQIARDTYLSSIFTSTDGIITADNMDVISTIGHKFSYHIDNATDLKAVRFDPVEGQPCIVENLRIVSDNGILSAENQNGFKVGGFHIFLTKDSQFYFEIPQGTSWLTINADIYQYPQPMMANLLADVLDLYKENKQNREEILVRDAHIAHLQQLHDNLHRQYHAMYSAFWWKITKPARLLSRGGKWFLKNFPMTRSIYTALAKVKNKDTKRQNRRRAMQVIANLITAEERLAQEKYHFTKDKKISVVVPLYNTPIDFLIEMIESLIHQTYGNWELCIADGSEKKHSHIRRICRKYAKKDARIKYTKLADNLGISGNTNKAIEMSTGDYIGLLDHDDLLHPSALHEVMRVIESQGADFIYTDEVTIDGDISRPTTIHYKPDFTIDYLRAINYICHFSCFSREILERTGYLRSEYDGSQDYDLILRLTEQADIIAHIPKVLYYWRAHSHSVAAQAFAKPYALTAAKKAISDHLGRCEIEGTVEDSIQPTTYRIRYKIMENPLVSIIIPNKDETQTLRTCIESINRLTSYSNFEIIIVENNSEGTEIFSYYKELEKNDNIRVVTWEQEFNFSGICNFGAAHAKGEHLLFLNNDIKVITPDWLDEMLMYSQRSDVGAVGAKLYYLDDTIQHAGVILGIGGVAGHSHKYMSRFFHGYMGRLFCVQNLSAVTGACMMMPKNVFDKVGGFDENYRVAFNDVDLCMRIRKAGYLIVFTPFAELYHFESKSRGYEDAPEKMKRFRGETRRFQNQWAKELDAGDPYYNPNLSLEREDFSEK